MENNNKQVWIWVAVIIIVAIGAWLLLKPKPAAAPVSALPTQSSITVGDQDPNTVGVIIASASLAVPGFIEIHADNNGGPGPYVGSSKVLSAGTHTNEQIIMTTTPGAYYWAMLHADDGNGIFEAEKDKPIMDASGNPVMMKFQVKTSSGTSKG